MTFIKPKGIKYTEMAMWIDANAYSENCDHEKLYEYLYHLCSMLSFKHRMCKTSQEYDEFSIFASNKYYLRLTDDRQNQFKENGEVRLPRVVSILNYIKKTLYTAKIDFDKEFGNMYSCKVKEEDIMEYNFREFLQDTVDGLKTVEFESYLGDVSKTVYSYIEKIPYRSDKSMLNNIYTSCLLSLINSVVLDKNNIDRIDRNENNRNININDLNRAYDDVRKNSIILFHLPIQYRDYISVLVTGIRKTISQDLSYIMKETVTTSSMSKTMLLESINDADER